MKLVIKKGAGVVVKLVWDADHQITLRPYEYELEGFTITVDEHGVSYRHDSADEKERFEGLARPSNNPVNMEKRGPNYSTNRPTEYKMSYEEYEERVKGYWCIGDNEWKGMTGLERIYWSVEFDKVLHAKGE